MITADFKGLSDHAAREVADKAQPMSRDGKPQESQNMEAPLSGIYWWISFVGLLFYISTGFVSWNPNRQMLQYPALIAPTCQTKNAAQKFLDSLLQKAGKLRGLVRDLQEDYSMSTTMQSYEPQIYLPFWNMLISYISDADY